MRRTESIREFGGYLHRYVHASSVCKCDMTFSVYLPPQAEDSPVPALYWLSGLTCTDDNARVKAGAQRYAAEQGIAVVFPDTSPRGKEVPDKPGRYDLGQGAGFYVDATQAPWSDHYSMYAYVVHELPALLEEKLPLIPGVKSISGHSMGGHGALICALKNPDSFCSVSAFAPICNPVNSGWGKACFSAYLGDNRAAWEAYDATCLIAAGATVDSILVDQGTADEFYDEQQLLPENLEAACKQAGVPITLRFQEGYDHSYHFIATFIGEHIACHAGAMRDARTTHKAQ